MKFYPVAISSILGVNGISSGSLAAESSVEGARRLTNSFSPDDTGTMFSTNGRVVTYLRYGKVLQWGLGVNTPTEINLEGITTAKPVRVAAGWYQQCAVLDDGKVACWGNGGMNQYGARGDQAKTHSNGSPLIVQMNDANGVLRDLDDVEDIVSGTHITCAVKRNRSLFCFGADNVGNRINPHYTGDSLATQVRFVASKGGAVTVVSEANEIRFFTSNIDSRHTPPHTITHMDSGFAQACYLMDMPNESDANMRCFGQNSYGVLGHGGAPSNSWSATLVTPTGLDSKISFVQAGYSTTCAIKASDKSQWCWGENTHFEGTPVKLGTASSEEYVLQPAKVITTGHLDQSLIRGIHVPRHAGYVLLADGTLHAWGTNDQKMLGIGNTNDDFVVSGADSAVPVFGGGASALPTEPTDWLPPDTWPGGGPPPTESPTASPTSPGPLSLAYDTVEANFTAGASNELEVGFVVGAGRNVTVQVLKTCDKGAEQVPPSLYTEDASQMVSSHPIESNLTHSKIIVGYNFNKAEMVNSSLWNSTGETLTFCQVTSLRVPDQVGGSFVILEDKRKIEVKFDLDADFEVDVKLGDRTIEEETEYINFDKDVEAYKCRGGNGNSFIADAGALPPNTQLAICVRVQNNTSVDIVRLANMVIGQDGLEAPKVFVENGSPKYGFTKMPVASEGVIVKTMLPLGENGFEFESGLSLNISGTVDLRLATGRKLRALAGENSVAGEEGEVAEINVVVGLQSKADGFGPIGSSDGHAIVGKGLAAIGLMVLAVTGVVMM